MGNLLRIINQLSRMGSFMIPSCLVVSQWLKTWREVASNSENPHNFHTKPLFWKIDFATAVKGFRSQYLVFSFWIKCFRRWYGQFYRGLPHFGPGGGGKVLDHPVHVYAIYSLSSACSIYSLPFYKPRPVDQKAKYLYITIRKEKFRQSITQALMLKVDNTRQNLSENTMFKIKVFEIFLM